MHLAHSQKIAKIGKEILYPKSRKIYKEIPYKFSKSGIAKIGKEFPYIQKVENLVRKSLINFQSEILASFKKLQN